MLKTLGSLLALIAGVLGAAPAAAQMRLDVYGTGRLEMPSTRSLPNRYAPWYLPWTPLSVSSATPLVAWFARQPGGTYVDRSGSGHVFAGPDASGQYASEAGWVLAQPLTVVDVFTNGPAPPPYQITFAGDASPGASGQRAIVFERYSGGAPQLFGGSGNASFGGVLTAGAQHTLVTVFNGTSSSASADGVAYTGLSTGASGIVNGVRTGGGDGGSYFTGTLTHRLVFAGALSADDRRRVEGWAQPIGGGVLGSDHPYATLVPRLGQPVPAARGAELPLIAAGSNTPRLGTYSGFAAANPDGSSAIPPTPRLFGRDVTTHKVFGSTIAQFWSGSTQNGETVESSIIYALSLLRGRGLQINLSIPLATGSNPYYQFPGMSLADVAAGAADAMFTSVANYLISSGFADDPARPVMIAYAQEGNGGTFPWASNGSATWNTQFVAAARHQHDVMAPIFAAAGKSVIFGTAWNKGKPDLPWQDLAANYPGDAYCDFVGMDVYDDDLSYDRPQGYTGASGGNTAQTPAQRFATSVVGLPDGSTGKLLAWLDKFARTPNMRGPGFVEGRSLPIVVGEWAAGGPTSIADTDASRPLALRRAYSGGDDGTYVAGMLQWFRDHNVYAHYFYDVFDTSIGYTGAVKWTPENTGMSVSGYSSTTPQVVGTGTKTYTVASGLPLRVGMPVIVRDDAAPTQNYIEATVSSYAGSTLTLSGFAASGSGTPAAVHVLTHPSAVVPASFSALGAVPVSP